MKKYFLIAIILAFTAQINAQSNLVFNQVLCFELALNTTVTVPEGKVWKVEHSVISLVADKQDVDYGLGLNNAIVQSTTNRNAIWFTEGTSIRANGNQGVVSILEFNVVAVSSGSGTVNTPVDDFYTGGAGTSYGDDYTPGESLTDNDGNVYETVTIGPQTWTTSNLDVSTYRDGTPIPYISDLVEWSNTSIGAYTYIEQNDVGLGKVYNMYAIIGKNDDDPNTPNKELAPEGYHIPSIQEYYALRQFYGDQNSAQLYFRSESGWRNEMNGNNESGLNIYPTGRISSGSGTCFNICNQPNDKLEMSYFGTKTNENYNSLVGFYVTQNNTDIFYLYQNEPGTAGFSAGCHIRLVKN